MCEFTIVKHIAVLSENNNGWIKEANIVSWNDGVPKLDIRFWSPDHSKMSKGITLSEQETLILLDTLEGSMMYEAMKGDGKCDH